MIEEPYRWVEAIANRREYIGTQLGSGSPIVALSYAGGIFLLTVGRQKLFEIYDRIALGAIGHPGDIERLRMAAIELASTEGFTRSAADVSLRRLAYYSLSPVMKNAFEQIYGAPFLARLLFVEIGTSPAEDLFLEVEYDGAINLRSSDGGNRPFAVLAATKKSAKEMAEFLSKRFQSAKDLPATLDLALDAWTVGQLRTDEAMTREPSLPRTSFRYHKKTEPFALVILDPGHGGQDSGAMAGNVLEKDLTFDIAERVDRLLGSQGIPTLLTRTGDSYVSLTDRAKLINRADHAIVVSIHFNDGPRPEASGIETYFAAQRTAGVPGLAS